MSEYVRGTNGDWYATFADEDGDPLVALDPATYPTVSIRNPSGVEVNVGTGTLIDALTGRYLYQWFVPQDAPIASYTQGWMIYWVFVTSTGQQIEKHEVFAVTDRQITDLDESAITFIGLVNKSQRVSTRYLTPPEEIIVELINPADPNSTTPLGRGMLAPVAPGWTELKQTTKNGQTVYYWDTPVLLTQGQQYRVQWSVRYLVEDAWAYFMQYIRVPEEFFWTILPSLRLLIDKVGKRSGTVQAYHVAQYYDYVLRGLGILNSIQPATGWTLSQFPAYSGYGLDAMLLCAAGLWAIRTQFLAEGELAISFGGQTVTLDYDRTGPYSSFIDYMNQELTERAGIMKTRVFRLSCVGVGAVRPMIAGRGRIWKEETQFGTGLGLSSTIDSILNNI